MKICYFISTYDYGKGGHFYSLKETAHALKGSCDSVIINIGMANSPIIDSANVPKYNVYFNGLNIISAAFKILKIVRKERPDIFHAFDNSSHFFSRLMSLIFKKPAILTKPGGANPRGFFPYADALILYSIENKKYFDSEEKFADVRSYLLPNRLSPFESDLVRIQKLRDRIDSSCPIFLRISRIFSDYKASVIQGVNLVNRLNKDGYPCQFILIGIVQDSEIYKELAVLQNEVFTIICEDEFTLDACQLIDLADYNVGTGNGIMEAASKSKVLLTPLAQGQYPLLVTEENFEEIFTTNFSPRNKVENYNEEDNYQAIVRTFYDDDFKTELQKQAALFFEKYFNIKSVVQSYCDVYRSAEYTGQRRFYDTFRNMLRTVRHFLPRYFQVLRGKK